MNNLFYFDHNALNRIARDGTEGVVSEIKEAQGLPVYSDENLAEIHISTKRKNQFLDILETLEAHHLSTPLNGEFETLEQFKVLPTCPRVRMSELEDSFSENSQSDGLLELYSMFYGGSSGKMPSEIALEQLAGAEADLLEVRADPDTGIRQRQKISAGLKKLKKTRVNVKKQFPKLDALVKKGPLSKQAAEQIGIGPSQLNNIDPPRVMDKVWGMVGPHYGAGADSVDAFLDTIHSYNAGANTSPEIVRRANGLYNFMNIAGYQRDEDLKKYRRMRASYSDMTHVGFAIACTRFYCFDERMRLKAQAIFEHLSVGPSISEGLG